MKQLRLFSFTILMVMLSMAANGAVSGHIENGLRVLDVSQSKGELVYTVYRGDYIVFDFADEAQYPLHIPQLGISQLLPKPASEKPYIKIKSSGEFAFTLGERKGTLHVLELKGAAYKEITAPESVALIKTESSLIIIDVRTPNEFNRGHIPGANLLPVQMFAANLSKLTQFRDEPILLYCASGNRSTVAAKMLIDAGFSHIYNLRRGMREWMKSQLPVE